MILLLSCMSTVSESDSDRYLRILSSTSSSNHDLLEECREIEGASLRGDCSLVIVRRGAISGGAAEWCPLAEPGIWQDECWFAASESSAMRGTFDEARQMCLEAGGFTEQCRLHVFQLLLPGEARRAFSEDFASAERHYAGLLEDWEPHRAAPALQRMWRDWFALSGGPLAGCGLVSQEHQTACEDGVTKTRPGPPAR